MTSWAKSNSSRELVQSTLRFCCKKTLHALHLHPCLLHAPQNTVVKGRQQGVSNDAIADLGDRRTSRTTAGGQQPEPRSPPAPRGRGGSAAAAGLKRLGGTAEPSFARRLCRFKAVPPFRARSGTGKRNWVFALPGRGERSAVPRPAASRARSAPLGACCMGGMGGEELGRGRASAPYCLPPASPPHPLCIPISLLHPFCFLSSAPLRRIATPVLFPTAAARGLACKSCLLAECVLEITSSSSPSPQKKDAPSPSLP